MSDDSTPTLSFRDLALSAPVLQALEAVGYETPSPIQAATIPHLLAGQDVLGQAQTGTGKTAAFALPILSNIDLAQSAPQALVLAPTRELAIQVAEAFQRYATHIRGFHVLPIYGGQSYSPQLSALKRGVHVVVGTPGRIMDHLNRGTLNLDGIKCLVLDEADEMLRMGFIDDVETILQKTPAKRQVALFSATMPAQIWRIAQTYLKSPVEITIKSKTSTATNIRQRYWMVGGMQGKLDALTRILEAEPFDGMLVFARTKIATTELAEKLEARGYSVAALNGDMEQKARERTVAKLKNGELDIVVATDIAARGLDVDRISHVINFDIPTDTESYVHRIGRTGRAGRSGEAILFIAPRERHLLKSIERATRQTITHMEMPTAEVVNDQRINRFKQKITDALGQGGLDLFRKLIESYEQENNVPAIEIASALARLVQGDTPLLLEANAHTRKPEYSVDAPSHTSSHTPSHAPSRPKPSPVSMQTARPASRPATLNPFETNLPQAPAAVAVEPPVPTPLAEPPRPRKPPAEKSDEGLETYRIEVGNVHGVKPGNIVGAIANEAGLDSQHIGRVDIRDDHTLIDLPEGMPKKIYRDLQKVWVCGQQLRISRVAAGDNSPPRPIKVHRQPKV